MLLQATDVDRDSCAAYSAEPSYCTYPNVDDNDFSAGVMCCVCGGGTDTMVTMATTAEDGAPAITEAVAAVRRRTCDQFFNPDVQFPGHSPVIRDRGGSVHRDGWLRHR